MSAPLWVHMCPYWDLRKREITQQPTHPSSPAIVHINLTFRRDYRMYSVYILKSDRTTKMLLTPTLFIWEDKTAFKFLSKKYENKQTKDTCITSPRDFMSLNVTGVLQRFTGGEGSSHTQELKDYELLLYSTLHSTVNPLLNMSLHSTANSFMRDRCPRRGEELLIAL